MRFAAIMNLAHRYILQRYNATRLLIGGVFEIVQAIVVQYEPTSFPRFVSKQIIQL